MDKIDQIIAKLDDIRNMLVKIKGELVKMNGEQAVDVNPVLIEKTKATNKLKTFTELRMLLNSKDWPAAISSELICDTQSENEKNERAEGIIDLIIEQSLKDKKFLDFGCGEGHIANKASDYGATISIGYDIKKPTNPTFQWESTNDKFILTSSFNDVKAKGPYDVVLLYDVLDHASGESMIQILQKVKEVTTDNSKIYVRCHPWCSRHGGHLYQQINKAFVHVLFTDEELQRMGYTVEPIEKIVHPIKVYRETIEEAGLEVKHESVEKHFVEKFFSAKPIVKERLMSRFDEFKYEKGPSFPKFQLEQCFIDYTLTH